VDIELHRNTEKLFTERNDFVPRLMEEDDPKYIIGHKKQQEKICCKILS
jgi:hypothetical protein